MIVESVVLSVATGLGFYLVYEALPLSVKMWLINHRLATRVICAAGVYTLLGGTIIALFSAAFLDLMIGTLLNILGDPEASESFHKLGAYLSGLRQKFISGMTSACNRLPAAPVEVTCQ